MNWKSLILVVMIIWAFAANGQDVRSRPNTDLDTTRIVGPDSSAWDTPPQLVKGKAPVYPISRLLSGKDGSSVIVYTIDTNGRAKDFEIQSAVDERYANHAIIAMKQWVFRPAMKDGIPVEARVRQEFTYQVR